MWSKRRTYVLLVSLGLLTLIAYWQSDGAPPSVQAQPGEVGPPLPQEVVSLPTERQALKKLRAAEDFIKSESFAEAIRILQGVIDAKEDVFLPPSDSEREGGKPIRWRSARTEANRLLAALPLRGKELYQVTYGDQALGRLNEARQNHNVDALDEISRRHFHTRAGVEALSLLAHHYLDRGRSASAAACYERLLDRPDAAGLPPLTLLHAALAFQQEGHKPRTEQAWKLLAARATPDGVTLGTRTLSLDQLRQEIDRPSTRNQSTTDWTIYRGNPQRTATMAGSTPLLEARWHASTVSQPETRLRLNQAVTHLHNNNLPVLPTFFPITTAGKLIYRSYSGLHAIDLPSGAPAWNKPAPLPLALDNLLAHPGQKQQLTGREGGWWFKYPYDWHILFENATIGSLSSDAQRVYAIDDLPLPPHPSTWMEKENGMARYFGPLERYLHFNQLKAFDVQTGNLVWQLGSTATPGQPFNDTYFLGPPLPLAGKLYVLTEKNKELRLVCLDGPRGELLWSQTLAAAYEKIVTDVGRRVHAAHLAFADGVLVCPTNAGAVVGVDPVTRNLLWAHLYRDRVVGPQDGGFPGYNSGFLTSSWKASAPIIHDGKVVFTAADGDTIRCLNLRDGTLLWKHSRLDDDCYLATVHDDKALLVGRTSCRALRLHDGQEAWTQRTGLPSGQGVASGNLYYLPLQRGGVLVLNLATGHDPTFLACKGRDTPGNLLFSESDLLSQNVDTVAAYPRLEARLRGMEAALVVNPNDPVALSERGRFRLDQGNLSGGVDDLRAALAQQPPPPLRDQVRARLYDALTRLLQRDFSAGEKYLPDYRDLCRVPVPAAVSPEQLHALHQEEGRRRIQLLSLLAHGREQQGRLLDAVQAYEELDTQMGTDQRLLALDGSAVEAPVRTWAAGRIAALRTAATPEQRRALDRHIAEQGQALHSCQDVDVLARFVALFGNVAPTGPEARLRLAELLLTQPEGDRWLEAEQHLLQLLPAPGTAAEQPQRAARALDALARLLTRKGLLADAVACYRTLGHDYARVVIRDGKTGADLLDEMAIDKRFLPHVAEAPSVWARRQLHVSEVPGNFPFNPQLVALDVEGDVPPSCKSYRLYLDLYNSQLRLFDQTTGSERWHQPLALGLHRSLLQQVTQMNGRIAYQMKGHVAVLNLGHLVYGLDLHGRRLLWQKELPGMTANPTVQPNVDGRVDIAYADGWCQRVGQSGPLAAPCLTVQTRTGLLALDPVHGDVLWGRTDITSMIELFGDPTHLYLVEVRGDGSFGGTRALRVADGATLSVPSFADVYAPPRRLAIDGRTLLLSEPGARDTVQLRLYDVHTGQDVWKKSYPGKSIVMQSQVPSLTGVVEPTGKATVFEVATGKEVLQAALEPAHVDKLEQANLLRDGVHYYLALKGPVDNNVILNEPWPNVQGGLRTVPINGLLYAFDRSSGQLAWNHRLANQYLLCEQFEDLPILLFTAQCVRPVVGGAGQTQVSVTRSIDKRNGKLLFSKEVVNNGMSYHAVQVDGRTGTIDLVSPTLKIRHAPVAAK